MSKSAWIAGTLVLAFGLIIAAFIVRDGLSHTRYHISGGDRSLGLVLDRKTGEVWSVQGSPGRSMTSSHTTVRKPE